MEQHEVIIAGAGPSGTACAHALRQAGVDVLILEKEKLPRHKICSGVLFGQAQELLKEYFGCLPPQSVYCNPREIPATHILEWSRDKGFFPYVWELAKDGQAFPPVYLNIWRSKFDSWLAGQCGAPVLQNCSVRSLAQDGQALSLAVFEKHAKTVEPGATKDPHQQLACRYLVGADGCSSTVRGLIDEQWRARPADMIVYQEYCRADSMGALREGHWHVFFEQSMGDILCCVHRKDDLLALCVGGFRGRDVRAGMAAFKKFLAGTFQVRPEEASRVEGCAIRQLPPNLGAGRVLLAGEAAGLVYLNGEGISAALDSGYRAGRAIAEAIRSGGDALELYRGSAADMLQHMELCFQNMHFLAGQ